MVVVIVIVIVIIVIFIGKIINEYNNIIAGTAYAMWTKVVSILLLLLLLLLLLVVIVVAAAAAAVVAVDLSLTHLTKKLHNRPYKLVVHMKELTCIHIITSRGPQDNS